MRLFTSTFCGEIQTIRPEPSNLLTGWPPGFILAADPQA